LKEREVFFAGPFFEELDQLVDLKDNFDFVGKRE
jgi:hypothetical protein